MFINAKKGGERMINTKLIGVLGVFLLVAGIWSIAFAHSAEAKGMPKCWLNPDGTVKAQYLKYLKSTPASTKFTIPQLKAFCGKQAHTQA